MSGTETETGTLDWRYYAYNLLLLLLLPLLALYLLWRIVVRGKSREGLRERLGRVPAQAAELGKENDPVIWVQACSVGEVAAVEPVIDAFRRREPMAHIVLSTTTPTGREMARKRGLELDALIYFPFDLPWCVQSVLRQIRPDMLVTVDTELWPNVMALAKANGLRTVLVNGRISDKAYPKDRAIRPIIAWTLSNLDAVLAQSEKDAGRFKALGTPQDSLRTIGNAKLDEQMPSVSAAEAAKLRTELGLRSEAPVFVAGSTREREEEKVLSAYDIARQEFRDLQLVIAPRHPERGDTIQQLIEARGYGVYRRSRAIENNGEPVEDTAEGQVRVVLLDTIGELTRVYALATVVFVGGSLVPWGGHNLLQPIAQGKPTLVGPWMHNQQDIADIALGEQAAETVHDSRELAEAVMRIVGSEAERELFATRAEAMMQKHGGASDRYADLLVELLDHGRLGDKARMPGGS